MAERRQIEPAQEPYDEPFFEAEPTVANEPVFSPVEARPAAPPEPVFQAVPAQTHGVSLPVDAPHSQVGWEIGTPATAPNPGSTRRRLGRTTPLWAVVVGVIVVAIVALVVFWFSLGRRTADEPALPAGFPTASAAGVVGSALVADAGEQNPAPEPTPLSAPAVADVRLSAGMQVVVYNTDGQGIRLRSAPNTNTDALTLGIYNDGAPFLVLSPGGDYGEYPVEADGYFWYRIRVVEDPADQLVGWAAGDFLVKSEP